MADQFTDAIALLKADHRKVEALFEKFARAKSESTIPGVGLGLAICRAIMQAHQGRIWAESSPSGGAAFMLAFPLGHPPSVPEIEAEADGLESA